MQPTSANIVTLRCCRDSSNKSFLDIKKKERQKEGEGGTRSKMKTTTQGDWIDRVITIFRIFFLGLLLIENKMIVIIKMMF